MAERECVWLGHVGLRGVHEWGGDMHGKLVVCILLKI